MFSILLVFCFLRVSLGGLENKEVNRPRPIRTNITIGALVPLNSGGLAQYAKEEIRAAKVAAAMINEDDDYLVRVNIISEPSGSKDPNEAAEGARKLADAGVDAIIGALRDSRSKAIMAVAEDRGLAQVSHGSGSNELKNSKEHPNFFRVIPNDDYQAQALMDVLAIMGVRKVGMVRTNDVYANGIAMKFQELWKGAGFDFSPPFDSPELEYEVNEVDALKAIDFIKNQGTAATNIICVGSDSDNGKLIDEIKAQEMDGRGYLWAGFDLFAADFDKAIEGSIGTQIKLPRFNPFYQSMLAMWEDMYPDNMPADEGELPYTAQMFDAVAVIAQAATDAIDAGFEANKTSILKVLQKGKVSTPGIGNTNAEGDVTIDESGNGPKTYEIMNFVSDRWIDVGDWGDDSTPKYLPETDFIFAGSEDFYLGDERPSEEEGESAMEIKETIEESGGLVTPLEGFETELDDSGDDARESSDDLERDFNEKLERWLGGEPVTEEGSQDLEANNEATAVESEKNEETIPGEEAKFAEIFTEESKSDETFPEEKESKVDETSPAKIEEASTEEEVKAGETSPEEEAKIEETSSAEEAKIEETSTEEEAKDGETSPEEEAKSDERSPAEEVKIEETSPAEEDKTEEVSSAEPERQPAPENDSMEEEAQKTDDETPKSKMAEGASEKQEIRNETAEGKTSVATDAGAPSERNLANPVGKMVDHVLELEF